MRRVSPGIVSILMVCLVATWPQIVHAQSGSGKVKPIWSGTSGGYTIQWTEKDLSVRAKPLDTRPRISARTLVLKDVDAETTREAEFDIKLLSVVGPILSFEVHAYVDGGGAHPMLATYYQVVDATHPARTVALTGLFPDAQVLKALLADKIIQKVLATDGAQAPPTTCIELVKRLNGKEFGGESDSEYGFGPDFLTEFAFHHIEGDMVAVRLSVSHGAEVYRGEHTQIGILLPIPTLLQHPFELARARKEGFLMQDAIKLFKDNQTKIEFSPPKKP
ncbi:MAG TPA: hypothetical protein VKU00_01275 [Chthonomonadaceae bacterium]|nr:hypothetical protein [Chthonomonadaceae bacterium]